MRILFQRAKNGPSSEWLARKTEMDGRPVHRASWVRRESPDEKVERRRCGRPLFASRRTANPGRTQLDATRNSKLFYTSILRSPLSKA